MTLAQFFRKARRGRVWRVRDGQVRCQRGLCPLAALTDGEWGPGLAAGLLDLRESSAHKIANAADNDYDRYRPWLLRQLGVKVPRGSH
jgi:hypothetical protein